MPHKSAYISLLLGANAHINYDLPLTLVTSYASGKQADLLRDLIRVDKLLTKSGREILFTVTEPSLRANFIKNHLKLLYFTPTLQLIRYWRVRAWRNSKSLNKNTQNVSRVSTYSARTARRFVWLDKQT